jgi:hypothetical protein
MKRAFEGGSIFTHAFFPPRLKPILLCSRYGTAEAVPLQPRGRIGVSVEDEL